jgi:nitroreductase
MDIIETIKTRRSVRRYKRDQIPKNLIEKLLEAGRWAPSASNSQPWNFILLKDEKLKREVANATTYGKFLADAPLGIAIVVDPNTSTHPVEDGSVAAENILLEAQSLGLGSCWIGAYNSSYEEKAKKILKIPAEKRLLSIISVGYPAESPKKERKELNEIVFTDYYGEK